MNRNNINTESFGNLFDEFFNKSISEILGSDFSQSYPSANIMEDDNAYTISLAAPGLEKSDFNITLEQNVLKIKVAKEASEAKYLRKEFSFDAFTRSFRLPKLIDQASIGANYENGILKVVFQKIEEKKDSEIVIDIS